MLGDSFDYASIFLSYRALGHRSDPYLLKAQQSVTSACYYLLAIAVCLMGSHLGLMTAGNIYAFFKKMPTTDDGFYISKDLLVLALIVSCTILVVSWTGVELYTNKVDVELSSYQDRVDSFNGLVFDNLYSNPKFLNSLFADDVMGAVAALHGVSGVTPLTQAVFTLNLYQYFRDRMPDAHPAWESIKTLFTVDGIIARKMDVTPFVSATLYSTIPNHIFDIQSGIEIPTAKQDDVVNAVTSLMTRGNKLLHALDPSSLRSSFRNYLMVRVIILLIITLAVLAYFMQPLWGWIVKYWTESKTSKMESEGKAEAPAPPKAEAPSPPMAAEPPKAPAPSKAEAPAPPKAEAPVEPPKAPVPPSPPMVAEPPKAPVPPSPLIAAEPPKAPAPPSPRGSQVYLLGNRGVPKTSS